MINIIIATDFSREARNAAFYAYQLGRELDANMILFNAYHVPQPSPGLGMSIARYDVQMQIESRLYDEAYFLDPRRKFVEVACDEGEPEDAILKIANERNADLIVTGMKGRGRNFRKLFGSTASALSLKTNVPVIVVPDKVRYTYPETLLFASDMTSSNNEISKKLNAIERLLQSELHVVHIAKNKVEASYEYVYTPGANEKRVSIPQLSDDWACRDISSDLNRLAEKQHADLLVMIPHKHGLFEGLLGKTQTDQMFFDSKIPLLILPASQNETAE